MPSCYILVVSVFVIVVVVFCPKALPRTNPRTQSCRSLRLQARLEDTAFLISNHWKLQKRTHLWYNHITWLQVISDIDRQTDKHKHKKSLTIGPQKVNFVYSKKTSFYFANVFMCLVCSQLRSYDFHQAISVKTVWGKTYSDPRTLQRKSAQNLWPHQVFRIHLFHCLLKLLFYFWHAYIKSVCSYT